MKKQTTKNKNLAAHHGGGPDSQGGAQQGTGARGEQYLDGRARSHTIVRRVLFGTSKPYAPKYIVNQLQNTLTDCPFFRSKRIPCLDRNPRSQVMSGRFGRQEAETGQKSNSCPSR
jgi:hypothetical protein